ncbi:MAG: hypothetical protein RLP14_06795 [Owenweeksia sp.]
MDVSRAGSTAETRKGCQGDLFRPHSSSRCGEKKIPSTSFVILGKADQAFLLWYTVYQVCTIPDNPEMTGLDLKSVANVEVGLRRGLFREIILFP